MPVSVKVPVPGSSLNPGPEPPGGDADSGRRAAAGAMELMARPAAPRF